ncbi:MAG: hypothetical protein LDL55_10270 [Armatimonadetes bacterium]|nr:hypothetical protein [Armatimonadota bacterium]
MSRDIEAVRAALAPNELDPRLPRLAKAAALALIDAGRPVTRSTLAAISKTVDTAQRKKPGFSEASLRTNAGLRQVYEMARDYEPVGTLRRSGHVGAHILRMRKPQIATALVVARMATEEREEEQRLALTRYGDDFAMPEVDAIRAERALLPANQPVRQAAGAAASRAVSVADSEDAIARAQEWASGRGIRPTTTWLAERCGLHPGTIERLAMKAATATANATTYGFDVPLPPVLLRHRKWDIGRALQVERDYIRALHAATMEIATIVIDREHQQQRAAARQEQ